tara:strand:+ start:300 stop:476 length:177 start_codon:yes stop_codon:yes gene_type:complete
MSCDLEILKGDLAQVVEQYPEKVCVPGSSPGIATISSIILKKLINLSLIMCSKRDKKK